MSVGGMLDSSQSAQSLLSPESHGIQGRTQSVGASESQVWELLDPESPWQDAVNTKKVDLILFLLRKYRRKQLTYFLEFLYMII